MPEISSISAATTTYEAMFSLLKQTLEIQQEAIETLMASMGIGTKIDIQV